MSTDEKLLEAAANEQPETFEVDAYRVQDGDSRAWASSGQID